MQDSVGRVYVLRDDGGIVGGRRCTGLSAREGEQASSEDPRDEEGEETLAFKLAAALFFWASIA